MESLLIQEREALRQLVDSRVVLHFTYGLATVFRSSTRVQFSVSYSGRLFNVLVEGESGFSFLQVGGYALLPQFPFLLPSNYIVIIPHFSHFVKCLY